jgi:hypothetical protein
MGLNRPFLTRYGPWAVITGASSGIGREAARELAARGMNLVLVARQEAALQSLRKEVTERHAVQCLVIAVDLATPSAREAVIARTQGLDVGLLISAAGFGTSGDFLSNPLWPEIEMLAVNVAATLDLTWHFGRRFAEQARGGIVLMSSIFAFQGVPRRIAGGAERTRRGCTGVGTGTGGHRLCVASRHADAAAARTQDRGSGDARRSGPCRHGETGMALQGAGVVAGHAAASGPHPRALTSRDGHDRTPQGRVGPSSGGPASSRRGDA